MKKLMRVTCFLLVIGLLTNLFTSCKKDLELTETEPSTEETTEQNNSNNSTETMSNGVSKMLALGTSELNTDSTDYCGCFDIFDGVDWDASEAEIIAQLEAILANLSDEQVEELFTPVCSMDGEIYLNACVAECEGVMDFEPCEDEEYEEEWGDCFTFVYPLDIVFPDATTQTVNSDDELVTAIENWYDANPNSDQDPTLAYPISVVLEDTQETIEINSDEELEDLFDACFEYEYEECFTFVFPLTIQFPDGTTAEINSLEEGETIIDDWYDANPNATEEPTLVFPIQVTLEDGTVETINNEEELDDLFDECYDDMGGCFLMDGSKNALTKGAAKIKKAN